jgi:hypothetical protein
MTTQKGDTRQGDARPAATGATEEPCATPSPSVDAAVQGVLGQKLREAWEEIVKEDIPPKLLRLLEELKRKEQDAKKDNA